MDFVRDEEIWGEIGVTFMEKIRCERRMDGKNLDEIVRLMWKGRNQRMI